MIFHKNNKRKIFREKNCFFEEIHSFKNEIFTFLEIMSNIEIDKAYGFDLVSIFWIYFKKIQHYPLYVNELMAYLIFKNLG